MKKWISISFSNIGKRESNQDFVYKESIKVKRRRIEVLLVCDGVGGRPNGEECSKEVGNEIIKVVKSYVSKRKSAKALTKLDTDIIKRLLSLLPKLNAPVMSRTTATLMLIDRKNTKNGYSCISLWAGDSRAYLIEEEKQPVQISTDQYNSEGHLSVVFGGDGKLYGELGRNFSVLKKPILYCVTTDGMNSQLKGLYKFFLSCVYHHINSDTTFEFQSTRFLSSIISDNYSSAMLYRIRPKSILSKTLKQI